MTLLMPWFLPLATSVAVVGTRTAAGYFRREETKPFNGALALALAWYPLLVWILAQYAAEP